MIPIFPVAVTGVLMGGAWWYARRRGDNSEREDMRESLDTTGLLGLDDALGWPYFFGKGAPSTPWESGPEGVDCSGFAQMALVRLGLLSSSYADRGAAALAEDSDPVPVGQQGPGDLAYYPGHVMVVISEPDSTGHSAVMGASNGTRTTFGNNPEARVKVFDTALYRGDFSTYMRLKAGKS